MKKIFLFLFLILFCQVNAQESRIDTAAIMILDRMGEVIGDLGSCGFSLSTSQDVLEEYEIGFIKYFDEHEVYMVGPDKMLINSRGDNGHQGTWYNGKQLAFYSYDENNYVLIDAPSGIIATIDSMHKTYGIDFPAADFFYPSFTDDLIEQSDYIIFHGVTKVDGKESFHIVAKNSEMSVQIWISDDAFLLPVKMIIAYHQEGSMKQYEASFSNWKMNPQLPPVMFEFSPPRHAKKIKILAK